MDAETRAVIERLARSAYRMRDKLGLVLSDFDTWMTANDHEITQEADSAIAAARNLLDAQPAKSACPHVDDPRGCYRVRCQLGKVCVSPETGFALTPQPAGKDAPQCSLQGEG